MLATLALGLFLLQTSSGEAPQPPEKSARIIPLPIGTMDDFKPKKLKLKQKRQRTIQAPKKLKVIAISLAIGDYAYSLASHGQERNPFWANADGKPSAWKLALAKGIPIATAIVLDAKGHHRAAYPIWLGTAIGGGAGLGVSIAFRF